MSDNGTETKGGKPNKGTSADRRLKENQPNKRPMAPAIPSTPKKGK